MTEFFCKLSQFIIEAGIATAEKAFDPYKASASSTQFNNAIEKNITDFSSLIMEEKLRRKEIITSCTSCERKCKIFILKDNLNEVVDILNKRLGESLEEENEKDYLAFISKQVQ